MVIERQGFPYEPDSRSFKLNGTLNRHRLRKGVPCGECQCSSELGCAKKVMTAEEKKLVSHWQDGLDRDQMTWDVWVYGVEGGPAMGVVQKMSLEDTMLQKY